MVTAKNYLQYSLLATGLQKITRMTVILHWSTKTQGLPKADAFGMNSLLPYFISLVGIPTCPLLSCFPDAVIIKHHEYHYVIHPVGHGRWVEEGTLLMSLYIENTSCFEQLVLIKRVFCFQLNLSRFWLNHHSFRLINPLTWPYF